MSPTTDPWIRMCDFTDCENDATVYVGSMCSACGRVFTESNAFCAADYQWVMMANGNRCQHCGARNAIRLSEPVHVEAVRRG